MKDSSRWTILLIAAGLSIGLGSVGCAPHADPPVTRWEAPYSQPRTTLVGERGLQSERLVTGRYGRRRAKAAAKGEAAPLDSACRVDARLGQAIALGSPRPETLLVSFRDTVQISRFPTPDVHYPRSSRTNAMALAQAESLALDVERRRAPQVTADTTFLRSLGGTVIETYWLIQAVEVAIPLSPPKIDSLLLNPRVRKVEPRWVLSEPPSCTVDPGSVDNKTDVIWGRQEIRADHYATLKLSSTWIGLLDTGIRSGHLLLSGDPPHLDKVADCVNGGADCTGNRPQDEGVGHGTSSAAILTAFPVPDDRLKGVTDATLDSYKVYFMRGKKWCLDVCATVRAFQLAVKRLNQVIVAEMQDPSPATCPELGGIAEAADHAFDAGAVVVAAVGNWGAGCATSPQGTACTATTGAGAPPAPAPLGVPASALRVLAIGSYDLEKKCCDPSQSWNQTPDGRFKPDIQLPTTTRTAGNKGSRPPEDDCALRSYGGTSAATAYAGGALALLRNLDPGCDPGQVYALAILSGNEVGPFSIGEKGAGRIQLPWDDRLIYDKISLDVGEFYDLPVSIPSTGGTDFRAAIWWPEYSQTSASGNLVDTHNDIDLELLDSSGRPVASSGTVAGVFERLAIPRLSGGSWVLRVTARTIRQGPQTVYCVAAVKY